jgi:hypothetical protein
LKRRKCWPLSLKGYGGMRRWLSQHVARSVRSRRVAGRFARSERVPGHIPAISPLRPISPMESGIDDVRTALNRPRYLPHGQGVAFGKRTPHALRSRSASLHPLSYESFAPQAVLYRSVHKILETQWEGVGTCLGMCWHKAARRSSICRTALSTALESPIAADPLQQPIVRAVSIKGTNLWMVDQAARVGPPRGATFRR